ncbi:MAG: hypothetical protein R3B47_19390 [Bacteroidia bacterium]
MLYEPLLKRAMAEVAVLLRLAHNDSLLHTFFTDSSGDFRFDKSPAGLLPAAICANPQTAGAVSGTGSDASGQTAPFVVEGGTPGL